MQIQRPENQEAGGVKSSVWGHRPENPEADVSGQEKMDVSALQGEGIYTSSAFLSYLSPRRME